MIREPEATRLLQGPTTRRLYEKWVATLKRVSSLLWAPGISQPDSILMDSIIQFSSVTTPTTPSQFSCCHQSAGGQERQTTTSDRVNRHNNNGKPLHRQATNTRLSTISYTYSTITNLWHLGHNRWKTIQ
jgi:hypothetical protein